jgi:hypothetical protein
MYIPTAFFVLLPILTNGVLAYQCTGTVSPIDIGSKILPTNTGYCCNTIGLGPANDCSKINRTVIHPNNRAMLTRTASFVNGASYDDFAERCAREGQTAACCSEGEVDGLGVRVVSHALGQFWS